MCNIQYRHTLDTTMHSSTHRSSDRLNNTGLKESVMPLIKVMQNMVPHSDALGKFAIYDMNLIKWLYDIKRDKQNIFDSPDKIQLCRA